MGKEMTGIDSAIQALTLIRIANVIVTDDTLAVDLEDGRTIAVPIGWYPRLAYGTPEERANFEISGAGYGIHWPDLDEDIGVGSARPRGRRAGRPDLPVEVEVVPSAWRRRSSCPKLRRRICFDRRHSNVKAN